MRNVRMTIFGMVVFFVPLVLGLGEVRGKVIYDSGGEYDIDFTIPDVVDIADHSGGAPTVVNLVAGGMIQGDVVVLDGVLVQREVDKGLCRIAPCPCAG